jgi:hypothetical protein
LNPRPSPWKGDALPTELLPLSVGEAGLEPATSWSQTMRAKPTAPLSGAEGGTRTRTIVGYQGILSPSRLPIPPPRLLAARPGFEPGLTAPKAAVLPLDDLAVERVMGFAPTAFSLATRRSTPELHPHLVPRGGVEPPSHVFQTRAVTTLATSAWWTEEDLNL